MNKMEILKNAFEEIGYKTNLWYHKENEIYYLDILGTNNRDGEPLEFCFNQDYEPVIWANGYGFDGEWLTLEQNYQKLEEEKEEDF